MNKLNPKPEMSLLHDSPSCPHQQLIVPALYHLLLLPLMVEEVHPHFASLIGYTCALIGTLLAEYVCLSVKHRRDPDTLIPQRITAQEALEKINCRQTGTFPPT